MPRALTASWCGSAGPSPPCSENKRIQRWPAPPEYPRGGARPPFPAAGFHGELVRSLPSGVKVYHVMDVIYVFDGQLCPMPRAHGPGFVTVLVTKVTAAT